MKIKIDKNGNLWLERAGKIKEVWCPLDTEVRNCGDWCALFREFVDSRTAEMFLCKAEHCCAVENFTDERGKDE